MLVRSRSMIKKIFRFSLVCLLLFTSSLSLEAATAEELNLKSKLSLERLLRNTENGKEVLDSSKAVLVFPEIYKAGIFFLGGEYGEGVLFSQSSTNSYYSIASGSFGWQLGAQKKSLIMMFMNDEVLQRFRKSSNWDLGVDASVAVITVGANGSIDASKLNKPILVFVIDQKGLMYNLTLEGTKITKINKD